MASRLTGRAGLRRAAAASSLVAVAAWATVDVYRIPSVSMEPALHGPGAYEDRVVVLPPIREPRRYDVVCFGRPHEDRTFVKRIVGLPGERIRIIEGDVFVDGAVLRKDRIAWERLRAPLHDSRLHEPADFWSLTGPWRVHKGGVLRLSARHAARSDPTTIANRLPLHDNYIDQDGRVKAGRIPVHDLALRVDVVPTTDGGRIEFALQEGGDLFSFVFNRNKGVFRLTRTIESRTMVLAESPFEWPTGELRQGGISNVDDSLGALVDGEPMVPLYAYKGNSPFAARRESRGVVIRSVASVRMSAHGLDLDIPWHAVFRDLHYTGDGRFAVEDALHLGDDEYFLLGDNSPAPHSYDSRYWGPVPRRDFAGLAVAVVFPFSQMRWL